MPRRCEGVPLMTIPHPLLVTRRKATIVSVDFKLLQAEVLWADVLTSVAATELAQLSVVADEFGIIPVVIRSDEGKAYEKNDGASGTMSDWDELTDIPGIPWLPGGYIPLPGDLAFVDIVADSPMIMGSTRAAAVIPSAVDVPVSTPETYTTVAGDTLPVLGTRFGIPWQIIAEWNGIVSPFTVAAGKVLRLTAPVVLPPKPAAVVQSCEAGATAPGGQFATTSTTFVALGPTVSISLVAGQAVTVTISVKMASTTDGQSCFGSFTMVGPGTNLTTADVTACEARGVESGSARWATASRTTKQVAGTGGQYTIVGVYKTSASASAAKFVNSYIVVKP
jgi:LysM repeat protein